MLELFLLAMYTNANILIHTIQATYQLEIITKYIHLVYFRNYREANG